MTIYSGPTWSTLVVEKDGSARLDRIGLTADQAHNRIDVLTYPGCPESFLLAPPAEDARREDGTFGVAYVIGNSAYIHAIGLPETYAKQLAVRAVEEHGPDAPRKPDTIRENADGSTTRMVDATPIVRQAHAIDMAEVIQMLEFA